VAAPRLVAYRYEYDRCTGCVVCFEQCPCHAIETVTEPLAATAEQLA
jgi:Pyruvate/2-oxoacid:ferredoxin oxidoreductase delta subunit